MSEPRVRRRRRRHGHSEGALGPRALPTARGLALAGIVVGTYVAARIVGTWELYLICLGFLGTLLLSWLMVLATARRLEADRSLDPVRPTAGDELVVTFRVEERVPAAGPPGHVRARRRGSGCRRRARWTSRVSDRGRSEWPAPWPQPARRGIHHLPQLIGRRGGPARPGPHAAPAGRPAGRRRLPSPGPPVLVRAARRPRCPRSARETRSAALGTSEFRGIRPHYPGEPLNHVDWKSTAKTGSLMLREMDDPTSGEVTLLLDGTASRVAGQPPATNYELAVQAAGSVADFALRTGRQVNLLLHESQLRQSRLSPDANGRRRLLESLAASLAGCLDTAARHNAKTGHERPAARTDADPDCRCPVPRRRAGARGDLAAARGHADLRPSRGTAVVRAPQLSRTAPWPQRSRGRCIALASRGVLCLSVEQGDDLRSALSIVHMVSPRARVR